MGQEWAMAETLLVDSDVLVDFFRGQEKAVELLTVWSSRIILSSIVVAELYAGVKGEREESMLKQFVALFTVIPVTSEIARLGGLYRRDYGKSHGVGLADGILAATAEVTKAELKTLNVKHYPMLHGIKPAYTKPGNP
jgi:predicted nucleic acid-binding protein